MRHPGRSFRAWIALIVGGFASAVCLGETPARQSFPIPPPPSSDSKDVTPGSQLPFATAVRAGNGPEVQIAPGRTFTFVLDKDGRPFAVTPAPDTPDPTSPFPAHRLGLTPLPSLSISSVDRPAHGTVEATGVDPAGHKLNYYAGPAIDQGQTTVPVFHGLRLVQKEEGITWSTTLTDTTARHTILLAAGWDLAKLRFKFDGSGLVAARDGASIIVTGKHRVRIPGPRAFQMRNGDRREFPAGLDYRGAYGPAPAVRIEVNGYDRSRDLTIEWSLPRFIFDPHAAIEQPYSYGFSTESLVTLDAAGSVMVVSPNRSGGGTATAIDGRGGRGHHPIFVVQKFGADGRHVYTTFVGGGAGTHPAAISVDHAGNLIVAGVGGSGLPLSRPPECSSCDGIFAIKLDGNGQLVAGSFTPHAIEVREMAVSARGLIYVAGNRKTRAVEARAKRGFVSSVASPRYVAVVDPSQTGDSAVLYAADPGWLVPAAVAHDSQGHMIVGGIATPGDSLMALETEGYSTKFAGGSSDGFILRIDPSRSGNQSLVAGTLIGGAGDSAFGHESVTALTTDLDDNVYAAGFTSAGDFPVSGGAWRPLTGTARKSVFVSKFDRDLETLNWSVVFGGTGSSVPGAIATDSERNVAALGVTDSERFPLVHAPDDHGRELVQRRFPEHLFLTKIEHDGAAAAWSIFVGGGGNADRMSSGMLAANGQRVVAGAFALLFDEHLPAHPLLSRGASGASFAQIIFCNRCPPSRSQASGRSGNRSVALVSAFGLVAIVAVVTAAGLTRKRRSRPG